MKKFLIACMIACTALSGSAQIIRSTTSERTIKVKPEAPKVLSWNHSGCFVNTGIGLLAGDAPSDFAWELGWGYRWHIGSGVSWEVFRFGFNTGVSHFKDLFDLRITTGLRYDSPRIAGLGERSIYANFCFGYGGRVSPPDEICSYGGFVYEIGLGVKLTRKCSLGLIWQGNNDNFDVDLPMGGYVSGDASWGMFGVKIEWQFR